MAKHKSDILIFDSGVGGLSIFTEIRKRIPSASICYASDNHGFPYGTKTDKNLINQVETMLQEFVILTDPKVIVIACNSASTIALEKLRNKIDIPIVGVVPAIKSAAEITKTKTIGLLATLATIERDYTKNLIAQFADDCKVIRVGSSELVHMAEKKCRGNGIDLELLKSILQPFYGSNLDTVVLGCTHFSHLKTELKSVLPSHVELIDSCEAIARQTKHILGKKNYQNNPQHKALFASKSEATEASKSYLEKYGIHEISYLCD